MTYYPYSQPGYYGQPDPLERLLAPARRASILMFILGGILMAFGVCSGVAVWLLPGDQLIAQQATLGTGGPTLSAEAMRIANTVSGVLMAGVGIAFIGLGMALRRGGMGSAVTALVLTILCLLPVLLLALGSLVAAAAEPLMGVLAIVLAVSALALIVLMVWLIQAVRNARPIRDHQLAQQNQYWQAMQYQQQYGQPYYGQYPQQPRGEQ